MFGLVRVWIRQLYLVALVIVISGCGREKQPGIYVDAHDQKYIKDMDPGDVIVSINGHDLCRKDYDNLQKLDEIFFRLLKGHNLRSSYEDVEHHVFTNERRIFDSLVKNELLRQAVEMAGIHVSEAEVESRWEMCSKKLSRVGKRLSEVQDEIGGSLGEAFYDVFADPIRNEKLLRLTCTNDYTVVTDVEMSNRVHEVAIFNETADRCNKEAYDLLNKVREDILSGRIKFREAARKYSEVHPEEGTKWCDRSLEEFPDELDGTRSPIRLWLEKAKPGDISPPFEMDDGISIIGLVAKLHPEVPEGMNPYTDFRLVRCTRYYRERSIEQPPDEMRNQLLTWKREAAMQELGKKLTDAAVIEFPHGTNLFPSVSESYKYWQDRFKNGR